ncbi:hypothetical protein TNCT_169421 [Trichonephila clavata]|uniref:Uncharacterized protein n=1 Tax=Trichonephila clavata TaxID=2740835 RepID=A0A8X6LF18_TRICU|nr:hypothetical protein TNCT_169421 [Trichonephila clavata]
MLRGGNQRNYFNEETRSRDVIDKQPSRTCFDSVCINISPDKLWNSMSPSPKTGSHSWDLDKFNGKRKDEIKFYVEFFIFFIAITFMFVIFILNQEGLLPIWFPSIHYVMGLPIIFILFSLIMTLRKNAYFTSRVMKCRWNTLSPLADMP